MLAFQRQLITFGAPQLVHEMVATKASGALSRFQSRRDRVTDLSLLFGEGWRYSLPLCAWKPTTVTTPFHRMPLFYKLISYWLITPYLVHVLDPEPLIRCERAPPRLQISGLARLKQKQQYNIQKRTTEIISARKDIVQVGFSCL